MRNASHSFIVRSSAQTIGHLQPAKTRRHFDEFVLLNTRVAQMLHPSPRNIKPSQTVFVGEYTDGLLDPDRPMLGPVADGGTSVADTTPGCWGPMITPAIPGGHEVTPPVLGDCGEVRDSHFLPMQSL